MAAGRMGEAATKNPGEVYGKPPHSRVLTAALDNAARGEPVFPCKPGDKVPLTKHGYLDATTDPDQIRRWWSRWPDANIGIPTGKRSGILALDVDSPASLYDLEAELGKLPATRTHGTGSGGMHYLFRYPADEDIRNSTSKIASGLDVRGEGGYIIVPPSRTTRPYEVLDDTDLADAPARLLEKLRRPHRAASRSASKCHDVVTISPHRNGPTIPEGTRNATLTSIAGRLHDGRTLDALTGELLEINAARCAPPLPDVEVEAIAASIYARPSYTGGGEAPDPDTLAALARFESEHLSKPYPGMAGKSDRDTVIALIKKARLHGTLTPAGVRVSVGVRALAVDAGVSKKSLTRKGGVLARLKASVVIRSDNAGRRATEAGAFILLAPAHTPRARGTHTASGVGIGPEVTCGYPLRTPRLRWGYPGVKRLGKTRGAMIDTLEAAGGILSLDALADALHHKRPRDLRRRVIPPLERYGMVEVVGDTVSLTPGYLDAVERRREATGEIAAETRDREHSRRKSAERRERLAGRDTRIPVSDAERAAREELREIAESEGTRRSWRAQRKALRDVRALERIPDLRGAVGRRVLTPRGEGELWDDKGEEARVILDADTNRWTPFHVADIELLEAV